jgi:Rho termination factor, N-terminal domain
VRKLVAIAPLAGAAAALVAGRRRNGAGGPATVAVRPENATRRELYDRAKRLNIHGRSRMNKDELMTAVADRERKVSVA